MVSGKVVEVGDFGLGPNEEKGEVGDRSPTTFRGLLGTGRSGALTGRPPRESWVAGMPNLYAIGDGFELTTSRHLVGARGVRLRPTGSVGDAHPF